MHFKVLMHVFKYSITETMQKQLYLPLQQHLAPTWTLISWLSQNKLVIKDNHIIITTTKIIALTTTITAFW